MDNASDHFHTDYGDILKLIADDSADPATFADAISKLSDAISATDDFGFCDAAGEDASGFSRRKEFANMP